METWKRQRKWKGIKCNGKTSTYVAEEAEPEAIPDVSRSYVKETNATDDLPLLLSVSLSPCYFHFSNEQMANW